MLFQHARTDLSEGVENAQHQSEEDTVRELVRRQERFEAAAEPEGSLLATTSYIGAVCRRFRPS